MKNLLQFLLIVEESCPKDLQMAEVMGLLIITLLMIEQSFLKDLLQMMSLLRTSLLMVEKEEDC